MNRILWIAPVLAIGIAAGCTRHEVELKPIKIEPIHVTVDVNVRLQREFADLFAFEDELRQKQNTTTQPSTPETP